MTSLTWCEEEDILEIPLLEPTNNLLIASPTPEEEAALLGEPQEAQVTPACPARHKEWDPKPKYASKLMETAAESQGIQVHLMPPPGFGPQLPGLEPLLIKEDNTLMGIPDPEKAYVALTPIGAMNMIVFRTKLTGNIEYKYETQLLQCQHPESPYPRPKITELWVEWVIYSELIADVMSKKQTV